jgi:hypothetical protein
LIEVVGSEAARAGLKCDAHQGIPPSILDEIMGAANENKTLCRS